VGEAGLCKSAKGKKVLAEIQERVLVEQIRLAQVCRLSSYFLIVWLPNSGTTR
jgi:hypothetical protein